MYLFTYGTLKTGEERNNILGGCRQVLQPSGDKIFLTEEKFSLYEIQKSFPALVKIPSIKVSGEVYEIDGAILRYLDMVEGYPYLYYRNEIGVENLDEKCTAYIMEQSRLDRLIECSIQAEEIKTGVWYGKTEM